MFKHILISTDGSPLANKAAKAGVALAHALRAKVTACALEEMQPSYVEGSIHNSKRTNDGNDDGLRRDRLLRFGAHCGGACGVDRARTQGPIERG